MSNFQLTASLDAYGMLWLSVLRQAMDDATIPAKGREAEADKASALTWLDSKEITPGSLHWICDVLGIDPDDVRYELGDRLAKGPSLRRRKILGALNTKQTGRPGCNKGIKRTRSRREHRGRNEARRVVI